MSKVVYREDTRGVAKHGWLTAKYSFSFADYYNPERVNFGMLRVLNDDIISSGQGFGTHPHTNMEIVTIPIKGSLEHKDSMGHISVIRENEIQIMSAGTGITHSEYNHSKTEEINLLQLWIFPKEKDIEPRYDQIKLNSKDTDNKLKLVVSPDKTDNALWINQDAYLSIGDFSKEETFEYKFKNLESGVYIFIIEGEVKVAGETLSRRDAIGISDVSELMMQSQEDSRILVIEVPMK